MLLAVIFICLVAQFGFGFSPVIIKKFAALSGANPLIFSLYRDILAFPLFLLVSRTLEKKIIIPNLMQISVLAALGFFGAYANQLSYIIGLYIAGPNLACSLSNTVSVWAVLIGMVCKLETFDRNKPYSWLKVAGIVASVAGAMEIVLSSGLNAGEGASVEGELPVTRSNSEEKTYPLMIIGCIFLLASALFMFFAGACVSACMENISIARWVRLLYYSGEKGRLFYYSDEECASQCRYKCLSDDMISSVHATHLVLQKLLIQNSQSKLMENWNGYPMNVMAWSYGIGTLCYGLSSLYYVYRGEMEVFRIPIKAAYSLTFVVTVTSVTCYLCVTWANYHSSSTLVAAFWPVQVLVTLVTAYFITGDLLHPIQYIGVILIVSGVLAVVFATHKEKQEEKEKLVL